MPDYTSRLKYIARKGTDLDLATSPKERNVQLKKFIAGVSKLLFTTPLRTLSLAVVLLAIPLTIIITITKESSDISSQAQSSSLGINSSKIFDVVPNTIYSQDFEFNGKGVQNISTIEILSPSWFSRGIELTSEISDEQIFYSVNYSGIPDFDITDHFAILGKAEKLSEISSCRGCDIDDRFIYKLLEFNLNTIDCGDDLVWGRNPLGRIYNSEDRSYCQKFENECVAPASWKVYDTYEECVNNHATPEIITSLEEEVFVFEVGCDGVSVEEPFLLDKEIQAKDSNGEVVRFHIFSESDRFTLMQDSTEVIVKQTSGDEKGRYIDKVYSANITGDITTDMIGHATPVIVYACDPLGFCTEKEFSVNAIQKNNCSFVLPQTGDPFTISIGHPQDNKDFIGIDNIMWTISGGSYIVNVDVNLFEGSCMNDNFITKIASLKELDLEKSYGYAVTWDSTGYDDGTYCIQTLAKDASIVTGTPWESSDQVIFQVHNINHDPIITSSPSKTRLTTGEQFIYTIDAYDPDGDTLTFSMLGGPDWLQYSERTVSGSTTTPGSYSFVLLVDDSYQGVVTQVVELIVSPPTNQPSEISIIYPQKDNVLKGNDNLVTWEASDPEGISKIELYYSKDGVDWTVLGSYSGETREANWNVSNLENEQYYLKIVVIDNSSYLVKTSKISDLFYIQNEEDLEGDGEVEGIDTSMPSIENISPVPDAEIYSKKPVISATLIPSNNAEILNNDVHVSLNDDDIIFSCSFSDGDIYCELENELELGEHKVEIALKDTNNKEAIEQWYFTVLELGYDEPEEEISDEEMFTIPILNIGVRKSSVIVSGVICLSGLLLVGFAWLIYFVWNQIGKRKDPSVSSMPSYTESPPPVYTQSITQQEQPLQQSQAQTESSSKLVNQSTPQSSPQATPSVPLPPSGQPT